MSDESQLQVRPKDSDSALSLTRVRSGLIARGRRDAAILAERSVAEPTEAISETRRLAEQGDADAQNSLGNAYSKGEGVPEDHAEAAKWYSKAAQQGHAAAQLSFGGQYLCGKGVPEDWAEAAKWFGLAAEQGDAEAQYSLGFTYHHSEGFQSHDYKAFFRGPAAEAVRWYRKAAEQGHTEGQYELGRAYYYGHGVPQDYTEAARWYRQAGERGNAVALQELGHAYYNGKGVPQDYAEGARWCWRAALQEGIDGDRYNIAYYCYHNVTQDYAEAMKWYRKHAEQGDFEALEFLADFFPLHYREAVSKAAEQGHAYWQRELGRAYYIGGEFPRSYEGQGFPHDYAEAAKWFRRAAEQGDVDAQDDLGDVYYQGKGVAQDYGEAVKWYRKAAERRNRKAQYSLGNAYYHGQGLPQDYVQAHMWMDLADSVSAGDDLKKYSSAREEVAAKMTSEQIAEAQKLAREWKPR